MEVRGRLWQEGQKTSVTVSACLVAPVCIGERVGVLEPPLDARVKVPDFADIIWRLGLRKYVIFQRSSEYRHQSS